MKFLLYISILLAPLAVIFFTYFNLGSLDPLVAFCLPKGPSLFIPFLSLSLRFVFNLFLVSELTKSGLLLFFFLMHYTYSVNKLTQQLYNFQRPRTRRAQLQVVNEANHRVSNVLQHNLRIYSRLRLVVENFNTHYCFYVVPILIFSGVTLIVICNYGTIRMYDTLGMPYFLLFPIMSFVVFIFTVTAVPEAAKVYELSAEYLRRVRSLPKSKYEQKLLRSLMPLGVKAGPFFTMKRSIFLTMIDSMAYYTMTLLLSFK